MRWIGICLACALAACAPTESDDAVDAPAGAEPGPSAAGQWITLFDGSSLDAFTMTGDANWTIEDGAVGADAGEGGMLMTNERFTDFELEVEFFVNVEANSGIYHRCGDAANLTDRTCYEANIFDTRPDQTYRTGGLVHFVEPAAILYTGGRWNRFEISANGSRLSAVLNGVEMYDIEDDTHPEGHIALQYGSGIVKFRNVRVRRL